MTASLDDGKTKAIYKIDPDAHSEGARDAAVVGHYILVYGPENKVASVETIK